MSEVGGGAPKMYSVPVQLLDHENDIVTGHCTVRRMISNEMKGLWVRNILEDNSNNWLLGIVLRHDDMRERRSRCCRVLCGGGYDFIVVFDDANIPQEDSMIPVIYVSLVLAMNQGGDFDVNTLVEKYGVFDDCDSLRGHVLCGLNSGFMLGDVRFYMITTTDCMVVNYEDYNENNRLIRFRFKPDTWIQSRTLEKETVDPYVSSRVEGKANNLQTKTLSVNAPQKKANVARTTEIDPTTKSRENRVEQNKASQIDTSNEKQEKTANESHSVADSSCYYAPFCKMAANDCGGIRPGHCKEVQNGRVEIPPDQQFIAAKKKYKNELKKKRKTMREAKKKSAEDPEVLTVDALPASLHAKKIMKQGEPEASSTVTTLTEHTKNSKASHAKYFAGEKLTSLVASKPSAATRVDATILASKVIMDSVAPSFNPKEFLLLRKALNGNLTAKDLTDDGSKFTKSDREAASLMLNDLKGPFKETSSNEMTETISASGKGSKTEKGANKETKLITKKDKSDKVSGASEPQRKSKKVTKNSQVDSAMPIIAEHVCEDSETVSAKERTNTKATKAQVLITKNESSNMMSEPRGQYRTPTNVETNNLGKDPAKVSNGIVKSIGSDSNEDCDKDSSKKKRKRARKNYSPSTKDDKPVVAVKGKSSKKIKKGNTYTENDNKSVSESTIVDKDKGRIRNR